MDDRDEDYAFRITGPHGQVAAGTIREEKLPDGNVKFHLKGRSWRPHIYSVRNKYHVPVQGGVLEIARTKPDTLMLHAKHDSRNITAIALVRELIAGLAIRETRLADNELSWIIGGRDADIVEARLFASINSPVQWEMPRWNTPEEKTAYFGALQNLAA